MKNLVGKTYELKEPFAKTYAKTLFEAQEEIYFIDMAKALNANSSNFFKKETKQLTYGAGGFNPNVNNLWQKKFSEMYDGLIFVKNITNTTVLSTK